MTIDLPESSKVAKVPYEVTHITLHYPRVALIATLSLSPAAASPSCFLTSSSAATTTTMMAESDGTPLSYQEVIRRLNCNWNLCWLRVSKWYQS